MLIFIFEIFAGTLMIYGIYAVSIILATEITGKSKEAIIKKVQGFFTPDNTNLYHIHMDMQLINELWQIIADIIGQARFQKLVKLSHDVRLFEYDTSCGVPCLIFTVDAREDEKDVIAISLKNHLENTLRMHGLPGIVIAEWGTNFELNLPFIRLKFAENAEQFSFLQESSKTANLQAVQAGNEVLEDEELF